MEIEKRSTINIYNYLTVPLEIFFAIVKNETNEKKDIILCFLSKNFLRQKIKFKVKQVYPPTMHNVARTLII